MVQHRRVPRCLRGGAGLPEPEPSQAPGQAPRAHQRQVLDPDGERREPSFPVVQRDLDRDLLPLEDVLRHEQRDKYGAQRRRATIPEVRVAESASARIRYNRLLPVLTAAKRDQENGQNEEAARSS